MLANIIKSFKLHPEIVFDVGMIGYYQQMLGQYLVAVNSDQAIQFFQIEAAFFLQC